MVSRGLSGMKDQTRSGGCGFRTAIFYRCFRLDSSEALWNQSAAMLWRVSSPRLYPAGFIEPCLPTVRSKPPAGPEWIHEVKHDGYRLMVRREGNRVRTFTRMTIWRAGRSKRFSASDQLTDG